MASSQLRVETIAIGDELLTGRISDTNSQHVADHLFARGSRLSCATVIPDDVAVIQATLRERAGRADILICFGGLGPTSDDKTAEAVAGLIGAGLTSHAPSVARIERLCRERGREVTPQMLKQAILPERTEALENPTGLAVGFSLEREGCRLYFLPGVPHEMKAMFSLHVLPAIAARAGATTVRHHLWRCLGVPESELQRAMVEVEKSLPPRAWLGYRTRYPENHLTLYWRHEAPDDDSAFARVQETIRGRVARWCYSEQDKELEQLVIEGLERGGRRLALAESCTGGLVAHRLTRVGGASRFVWGGFTCYQPAAKETMLGVRLARPEDAVSADCSRRLAAAALRESGCDVAAAITGYMGPTGGTAEDPIGTIYLAVAGARSLEKRVVLFQRERAEMQWGAATFVLDALRTALADL